MNRLAAILPASNVLVDVDATSKKRAFEHAGLLFENQHAIARATVTDNLFARERLGSTGLGHGVAIPHGRIKGLKNPLAAVCGCSSRSRSTRPTTSPWPSDLPAGARSGDPAAPRDPVRNRRDAERPRAARAPQDRRRRAKVHELISNWEPLKSVA
jgi:PTS system nitrogen regulatory IIA component